MNLLHFIPKYVARWLWGVGVFLFSPALASISLVDSQVVNKNTADILYRIKWSLVQTTLQDSTRCRTLPADVRELFTEAQEYARQQEYEWAIAYLDIVINFLMEQWALKPEAVTIEKENNLSAQIFCGSDLWQQKFSVSITDQDSTIYEDQNNAFIGIRSTWEVPHASMKMSRMAVEAKVSREYLYGYFDVVQRGQPQRWLTASFENRLEGMHYSKEKELRYWHNRTQAVIGYLNDRTSIALEEELQVRTYAYESSFFASFWQNQAALTTSCDFSFLGKTEVRYDYRLRRYVSQTAQNYQEHLFTLTVWPNYALKNQLRSFTQFRWRSYDQGMVDSLLTNPFDEFFHESKWRGYLRHNLHLLLGASINLRHYRFFVMSMPHYRDVAGEVGLEYQPLSYGSIKIGYRYRDKKHYFSQEAAQATAAIEDFYAHAPTVEADIYYKRLLLHIGNLYEKRHYPSSPDGALSLYADRDVYSLYLFLSWAISLKWELNVMVTIDDDWPRNPYASDSRSNIINFELLFKL